MLKIIVIYSESIAKQLKIKGSGGSLVLVLVVEDEIVVISKIMYSQEKDELLGFCGVKGLNYQCFDYFIVKVGDGEEGYNIIFSVFRNNVIGNYVRVIIFNLLVLNFLCFFILIMLICNCFDIDFVYW